MRIVIGLKRIIAMTLSEIQRRIRRSKDAERREGHWFLDFDGPDPKWKNIASSAGRVGHVTQLQFDTVSKNYCVEVKNVKVPAKLWKFWMQIVNVAAQHGKEPVLAIVPTNEALGLRKKYPAMHIITDTRHAVLLEAEREVEAWRKLYGQLPELAPSEITLVELEDTSIV